jgi:5-formyltetrahydrofolate cyclo-ligase
MDIIEQKKALRKRMYEERKTMDPERKAIYDGRINEAIYKLISERNWKTVHAYIPLPGEIDIRPLIQRLLEQEITIVAPKTLPKRKLENRVLRSLAKLETGIMGTQHPDKPIIHEDPIDLIIVPGMAFDAEHYRLGYGGGYYDNFIVSEPTAYKLGIFYPFQQVKKVPIESHDKKLDSILTTDF